MSLSDEIEAWLARDIAGHVERILEITRPPQRERRLCSTRLRIDEPVQRHGYCSPWRHVEVEDAEPDDLRAIADIHQAAAVELMDDATELRNYADALERGSDLGAQLAEHFRTLREARARRKAEFDHAWTTAHAEGGVTTRFGRDLGGTLMSGGLLTVDDVRAALLDGRLIAVDGIGPARFAQIARELQRGEGTS